ncbi:MAG: Uma2 family endonuclease [Planctomycetaceae bacterium]|nr:Uma2 family endonuclease [Planctomycetaceae bacterium]
MSTIELTPALRLDRESNGMLMTSDEFDAIEDVEPGRRYELIRGVVIVTPPPDEGQRGPNDELGYLLRDYRDAHPEGSALDDTLPENYIRVEDDWRIAERALWCGLGRRPDAREDVPTIAVEFVSAGGRNRRRDYVEKRRQYLRRGVKEYWIIDRFRRRMTVVFADDAERVVTETETYATPFLPGFELPLAKLLAVADRWSK